ncbi:DNA-dependent protein kinase catalytic subunit-like [Apostichopus japonicus]|uniref:DNA-dependent protein kinase catalytic subunit-like n=1 Tax=Stichopus japonicus TaxID=307972 RepID=UPI003AB7544A
MAVPQISAKLSDLYELLKSSRDTQAAEEAKNVIVDLGHVLLRPLSDTEQAFATSEVFHKERGLLSLLKSIAAKEEFTGCKEEALRLIGGFLKKRHAHLVEHAVDIKDTCTALYLRDKSSKVKASALEVLTQVLQLASSHESKVNLNVSSIIKKFVEELMKSTRAPQGVKSGLCQLLGVISEVYPEEMLPYGEKLTGIYVSMLRQQMTSKNKTPEMTTIAGCLIGLSHVLVNFTQSVEEDGKHTSDIYKFASSSINPSTQLSRYAVPEAGLRLFGRHAPQFGLLLYRDYETMYEKFLQWSEHHNKDMKSAGLSALETFLKLIAEQLVTNAAQKTNTDKTVFQFFIRQFRSSIDNTDSGLKSWATAIRGYGFFASPCKAFCGENDVKFMFSEMIQRSEQLFLQDSNIDEDRFMQLPHFLEALANIISELGEVPESFLNSLEGLTIVAFRSYPSIPVRYRFLSHRALFRIFLVLHPKGTCLQQFLSKVVFHALAETCSHPVLLEGAGIKDNQGTGGEEDDLEVANRKTTYKSYLDLWASLLDSQYLKEIDAMGMTYVERKKIHATLYNEMMTSMMKILTKLDLSATKSQAEGEIQGEVSNADTNTSLLSSSDPVLGLQAAKPRDFQIFINLVDFCRDLLPRQQMEYFKPWVYQFGHQLILLSTRFPLVSGLYKLLTACMVICQKTGYFKQPVKADLDDSRGTMEVDPHEPWEESGGDRQACFTLFAKFAKEVTVRLTQYKDDLLASCLFMILALPLEIVQQEVNNLVPALQATFKLGLSYLPLAEAGISSLQMWTNNLPIDTLTKPLKKVLPLLDGYLRARSSEDAAPNQFVEMKGTLGSGAGRRRIPVKLLKTSGGAGKVGATTSPLRDIQHKILQLLGSLGGKTNISLLESSSEELAEMAVAWDTQKKLSFAVPFMDMKPTIFLDPFLPRVVELALSSGDRPTKVAACELLHTLVLFMLGKGTQQPDQQGSQVSMVNLYKHIFQALLHLACDPEQVARQLFQPLVFQLIHWFTGNKKFESEETMTLLNAILEGIIHPTDTALRDFSGQCVKEFLKWSIKQTPKKQLEKSPINTKSLLKRLYSMALHPSALKRLGAALAFNNIYTVFREEDSLVEQFTFEILATFVQSLAMAHHDAKSLGTQEQASEVLKHLERIMKSKANILNKESKHRRIPSNLPGNCKTLSHLLVWLINQCGSPATECRHQCMALVFNLSSVLPGSNSANVWMKNTLKEKGASYFINRFEGGGGRDGTKNGIQVSPRIDLKDQPFSLSAICNWFDLLLGALDCYTWIFGQRLLTPSELFHAPSSSNLTKSLQYFLDDFAQHDLEHVALSLAQHGGIFTPWEQERYNQSKCTVAVRVMDFLTVLLGNFPSEAMKVLPSSFWVGSFSNLLCSCFLNPVSVGFNMADVEVMNNLPKTTSQLLELMAANLPPKCCEEFKTSVAKRISSNRNEDLLAMLPSVFENVRSGQYHANSLEHLISGYKQLQKAKFWPLRSADGSEIVEAVFKALRTSEDGRDVAVSLRPAEIELGTKLLELAFQMGVKVPILVDLLTKEDRKVWNSTTEIPHCEVFYAAYKSALNDELACQSQHSVRALLKEGGTRVMGILNGLLDQILSNRNQRKRYGMVVHSALLTHWGALARDKSPDAQRAALLILKKLLQIDSKFVTDVSHVAFQGTFTSYLSMLTDPSTNLTFKTQALEILYFFVQVPDSESQRVREALDQLVVDNFPLKSSEFGVGSAKYNDYIAALNKLLTAMVLSGSMNLLEIVIGILCREEKHTYEVEIIKSLESFIRRMDKSKQVSAIGTCLKIFQAEGEYTTEMRRAVMEKVCLPMFRLCQVDSVIEVFQRNIRDFVDILENKLKKISEAVFAHQLVSKICCFELIELLYTRLGKDQLNSTTSAINSAYCMGDCKTGKEMTQGITKAAHFAKSENVGGEKVCIDLRRQYHCAAYNALIAIITCTQTDVKFYNAFLFQENVAKGQFLLENIIDEERAYEFEVEISAPLERKKKFVALRLQAASGGTFETGLGSYQRSGRYLSSQYLADSSLSEDVHKFDFTGPVTQTGSSLDQSQSQGSRGSQIRGTSDMNQTEVAGQEEEELGDYLEMEGDELNQHECMASVTAVLRHMMENKITPEVTQAKQSSDMPPWMKMLHGKMSSSQTSVNIKLFVARLIVNCSKVFEPFAKFWLNPLIQLIIGGEISSPGIHYMLLDIMVVLFGWSEKAIPEDKYLASQLLRFLMLNVHHTKRAILRNNLEVVKTLVELWKPVLDIPTSVIYDYLSNKDPASNTNTVGVQLLGVVLANNIHPFSSTSDVDSERFYAALATNLKNRFKQVHAPAAEVVGMTFRQMADNDQITDGYLHQITTKELTALSNMSPEIFINCVNKITLHYPEFANRFLNKLLFVLPSIYGAPRVQCLEVISSRVEKIENVFQEIQSKGLKELLTHRDESTQVVSLKLINGMLPRLSPAELTTLLPDVKAFTSVSSIGCREVMYDIFIWIYDHYRDEVRMEEEGVAKVLGMAKDALLLGLSDKDPYLRLRINNFWSHENRLPVDTLERMVALLECMYSPSTEDQYLSYSTSLLLEMTSKSPDYKREMFEHPLSDCRFQDISIDSSYKQRHQAINTPLFVETQQGSGTGFGSQSPPETLGGQVRATQDGQQFTATQDLAARADGKNAYNWLTGSQDTFASYSASLGTESSSSFLFTIDTKQKVSVLGAKGIKVKPVGPGFGKDRLSVQGKDVTDTGASKAEGKEIMRLKRRFLKDQQKSSSLYFAKRELKKQQMREELLKEQKERRYHQVTLYRSYRVGDLPDIQIKYMDLIAPLQAVAQKDAALARMLFSSIFGGIFVQIGEKKTEREAEELVKNINQYLNQMLSSSSQFFPHFISCIQEIALCHSKEISLDPVTVTVTSLTSKQIHLGIRVLEEMLIKKSWEEERATKRSKTSHRETTREISTWIELARLYKDLGQFDVLQGIFGKHIDSHEITHTALQAEARGDYAAAVKLYNQAISDDWEEGSLQQIEEDLWDEARLECCNQLTQWEELENYATMNIDDGQQPDITKVWDGGYSQDLYLPYMIRSKIKLLQSSLIEGADTADESLLQFVDNSMQQQDRRNILEVRNSEDLTGLFVIQEDYQRARYYLDNCTKSFLEEWSSMNPLMTKTRSSKLQGVQRLMEIHQFVDFMNKSDVTQSEGCRKSRRMLERWSSCLPDPKKDSVTIWDDIVTNRCLFMEKFATRFDVADTQGSDSEVKVEFEEYISMEKTRLSLKLAESASEQANFPVALKHLKSTYGHLGDHEDLRLLWTHTYVKMHQKKASLLTAAEKVTTLLTTFDPMSKLENTESFKTNKYNFQSHQILSSASFEMVADALNSDTEANMLGKLRETGKFDKLKMLAGGQSSISAISSGLYTKALKQLQEISDHSKKSDSVEGESKTAESFVALGKFCDKILKMKENEEDADDNLPSTALPLTADFPSTVVKSFLTAMRYSSSEAKQRFPRLLQIIETYPETLKDFIKETSSVPCWMFIGWISQMVALLDKPEADGVAGIVKAIAVEYPQALVYPYKTSSENCKFSKDTDGKKRQQAMIELKQLLNFPVIDQFTRALDQLNHPGVLFKDWADDELKPLLQAEKRDNVKIKKAYSQMEDKLLNFSSWSYEGHDLCGIVANFRTSFARKWLKKVEKVFGKGGEKLLKAITNDFTTVVANMYAEMNPRGAKDPGNLKEYSPWFLQYQLTEQAQFEIPGQYTGVSKPLPEYHVKIAGFDEQVRTLQSLRKPKTIKIRGHDEKDYEFLVKGGEDLRLDQRIEQLFCIMNDIMAEDTACSSRELNLTTYQVTPMTSRLGLIEFVPNTTTWGAFLKVKSLDKAKLEAYGNWVQKFRTKKDEKIHLTFATMYKQAGCQETTHNFRQCEEGIPWDLSRKAFLEMSASPEAFLALRTHFAKSFATLCICQYILGIGDRHLSNFLVSLNSGRMIGIDFGHAFGSATLILPIPELMPFRLTRQIVNLMMPMKIDGLLKNTMVHCLRALRQNHDLLLNTMDVFIKEPSVDWKQFADKTASKGQGLEEISSDALWYPKERLLIAKAKLEGANPAYITERELEKSVHGKSTSLQKFIAVVRGDHRVNIRAQVAREPSGLSVEDQVACLIEQATDPNILGRTYQGWQPFI